MSDRGKNIDDFEEDGFEEDILEDGYDDDLDDDDLFEDEDPPPPPPSPKKDKKAERRRRPKKTDTPPMENRKKSPLSKYMLIGITAVCVIGGGLWVFLPFFMPGNQGSYPSQSQTFQTQAPSQPAQQQPSQLAQQPAQTSQPQSTFVDDQSQSVPVQSSQPAEQPAETTSGVTASSQSHMDNHVEDKQLADIQKMMAAQKKQLERLEELEKLEKIYLAVQEIQNRAPANGNFSAENEALKAEKDKLLSTMESLKAEIKDLKGKNTYLRHLHSEQKSEIQSLKNQLAQKKTNTNSDDRFLGFMNTWQLTGLTSNFVIFRNTKDSSVVRVSKGGTIDGIQILNIDSYAGIIKTSEGDIMFNAG